MYDSTEEEISITAGGIGPIGALIGGAIGGVSQAYNGAGAQGILSGIALGALSGLTGGLAAGATGFTRLAWGVRSVGSGFASGASISEQNSDNETSTSDE